MSRGSFLMAYFLSETEPDGEQVRLALSLPGDPTRWTPLQDGAPVLRSTVGERGVRDPFLVRHPITGRISVIATDLRIATDGDWERTVRTGSRNVVVWSTDDLESWSGPQLVQVAPPEAGNTWAPKAFWSTTRQRFLMIWASTLYQKGAARPVQEHQRLLIADTEDFSSFSAATVYLDPGYDVIDATFIEHSDRWYRFSANAQGKDKDRGVGHHIFMEAGNAIDDPHFVPIRVDIGKPELVRGEGPAVFADREAGVFYLLIDEFGLTGYHLFSTRDPASGEWTHERSAQLPRGARHGSVIPISQEERETLLKFS